MGVRLLFGLPVLGAMLLGSQLNLGQVLPLGTVLFAAGFRAPWRRFCAVLLCGILVGTLRAPPEPAGNVVRGEAVVWGRIQTWKPASYGASGLWEIHRINSTRLEVPRKIPFFFSQETSPVPKRSWVRVRGELLDTRGKRNPGERESAYGVRFRSREPPVWGPGNTPRWLALRAEAVARIHERFPGWCGRLAQAMVLGDVKALSPEEARLFRRSGLAHLTAVSGLHVGFVFTLALGFLAPLPYRLRCLMATGAGTVFAGLAGFPPSACRAVAMMGLALVGSSLGRGRTAREWVVLALVWMTWSDPSLWRSLSFQLSIAAVSGILLMTGRFSFGPAKMNWKSAPLVSMGAQAGTLPLMVDAFGAVPVFALLPNLAAVPLAAVFVPVVMVALWMPVPIVEAMNLASLGECLAAGIGWIAHQATTHFWVWDVIPKPHPMVKGWYLAFLLLTLFRIRPRRLFACALAGCLAACFIPTGKDERPWVTFLDVGQGDAALVGLTDGTTWLVDVGDDRGFSNAATQTIIPYLRHRGIRRLHGVILSHPHRDHVGGLPYLGRRVSVDSLFVSPCYGSLRAPPGAVVRVVQRGDRLGRGGPFQVLHPTHCRGGTNDLSLVAVLRDSPLEVLFTGDVEVSGEKEMLEISAVTPCRIMKVGHHGSATSSSPSWLDQVAPELAVISCGVENRFGHPHAGVVARLSARARVYRTDQSGAVEVRFSEGRIKIEPFLGAVVPP